MEQNSYILAATKLKKSRDHSANIAIIPWGATEAHNYHLPYGTDNYLAQAFAEESARKASLKNINVIVLPTIPFGVNTGQMDIPLTINMNPSTQALVLRDIIDSLQMSHLTKVVVFNGHGGNDFRQMIREFQVTHPGMFICQVNYYQVIKANKYFEKAGEHADEMETSLMMHLFPQLVLPLSVAGDGEAKELVFAARKEGWMWAPRRWNDVTEDTGIGNPFKATAKKGKEYYEEATDKIAGFLEHLGTTNNYYVVSPLV